MKNRVICSYKKCYHYQAYLIADCPAFYNNLGCTHLEQIRKKLHKHYAKIKRPIPYRVKNHLLVNTQVKLLEKQGYNCFVCHNPLNQSNTVLNVNHKTGKARAYLCRRCSYIVTQLKSQIDKLFDNPPAEQFYT